MADLIVEVIGWIGMILILLAYLLITIKKLDSQSRTYHGMNLFGSILVGINAFVNRAYPSTASNVLWVIVAIYGLIQGLKLFKK